MRTEVKSGSFIRSLSLWQSTARARYTVSTARLLVVIDWCFLFKNAIENLSDVSEVMIKRERIIDLRGRQLRLNVCIRQYQRPEIFSFVPNPHRVSLHPFVSSFSRNALVG